MQHVLVTGGAGFLGAHIVRRLVEDGDVELIVVPSTKIRNKTTLDFLDISSDKVNVIQGDIRDFDFVQRMFNEYELDTVFHLAALSEVRKCQNNPKLAFDTNINGTINILETARLCGTVERAIVSSSDKAYGRSTLPYKENYRLDGRGIYEATKSCTDLIARSYFYNYGLPVAVTRCSNLYGGGDLNYSRIIPNTIRLALQKKSPLVWTGAEKFIREFLYIEDAVDAYLSLATNIDKTAGEAYNIGSGEKITIGELVKKILQLMSSDVGVDYRERSFPEISNQYLDSSKIREDIGWYSKVSLDEGLTRTIRCYAEAGNA
jgi:CDP-glucose 4,6-dehydratase